jgi:hypothetical protein
VEDSLHAHELSVREIFEGVYRDSGGRDYWHLWLKYGPETEVARLLTAHFVTECRELAAAGHPFGWKLGTVLPCGPRKVFVRTARGSLEVDR